MKHVGFAALTYAAVTLQVGAGDWAIGPFVPQFLWMLVIAAVFLFDGATAIAWAAALGLLSDCLAPDRIGVDFATATLTAAILQRWLPGRTLVGFGVWLLPSLCGAVLASLCVRCLLVQQFPAPAELCWLVFGASVYSTAIAIGCVGAVRFTYRGLLGRR